MGTIITLVYGHVDEEKTGIVELRFDSEKWESKKVGKSLKLRRKGALPHGAPLP